MTANGTTSTANGVMFRPTSWTAQGEETPFVWSMSVTPTGGEIPTHFEWIATIHYIVEGAKGMSITCRGESYTAEDAQSAVTFTVRRILYGFSPKSPEDLTSAVDTLIQASDRLNVVSPNDTTPTAQYARAEYVKAREAIKKVVGR